MPRSMKRMKYSSGRCKFALRRGRKKSRARSSALSWNAKLRSRQPTRLDKMLSYELATTRSRA